MLILLRIIHFLAFDHQLFFSVKREYKSTYQMRQCDAIDDIIAMHTVP